MVENKILLTNIPDSDEPEAGQYFVSLVADGVPYDCLLDTGSSRTIVHCSDFSQRPLAHGTYTVSGLFGRLECDLFHAKSLELGPLIKQHFELACMQKGGPKKSQVGMDLLSGSRLHFDFISGHILLDPEAPPARQELIMDSKNIPYVDLTLNDSPVRSLWDTGAGLTCVDLKVIQANAPSFNRLGSLSVADSAEQTSELPVYEILGLQARDFEFHKHKVLGVDLSGVSRMTDERVDIVLGYNSVRMASWYFDFIGRSWALLS